MTVLGSAGMPRGVDQGRRWNWLSGPCRALDHAFQLKAQAGPDVRAAFEPLIAPFRVSYLQPALRLGCYEVRSTNARHRYTLFYDDKRVASGSKATDLTGIFTWHVNRQVIDCSVRERVLLHAAAAIRGGQTVILPADQESGKTTTVAGLLRSGFDYLTDEAVAIDPRTGWITPFPKSLTLDPGSWPLFPECAPEDRLAYPRHWLVPARRLGARVVQRPLPPPRVVVFPKFVRGARTTLTPLSAGEATQELVRMSFDFPRYAGRNLAVLGTLAARARSARLVIGSLTEAVAAIERLVSERILEEM